MGGEPLQQVEMKNVRAAMCLMPVCFFDPVREVCLSRGIETSDRMSKLFLSECNSVWRIRRHNKPPDANADLEEEK